MEMDMISHVAEEIPNAVSEKELNVVKVIVEQDKQGPIQDQLLLNNKQAENEEINAIDVVEIIPNSDIVDTGPSSDAIPYPTPDNFSFTLENPPPPPDYLSPILILIIFNIGLPTTDVLRDLSMLIRLSYYPQHWSWGIYLFAGVLMNFLFTCWAWWRLDARLQKRWTWILLLLQVSVHLDTVQATIAVLKLDGVGPVKYRPYTD